MEDRDMAGLEVLRTQCQQSISTQTELNEVISIGSWSMPCIYKVQSGDAVK